MRADRVDLLLQYVLLKAGEEDSFIDRDLGPIHLLKYVYLADLAHARMHQGETFTGVPWQFYHFGPWSPEVYRRIEPALTLLHAHKFTGQSDFEERSDWIRWSATDDRLLREIQRKIPAAITMDLDRLIHKFKKDTPSLLGYVYQTAPMLAAAPNERLDFALEVQPARSASVTATAGLTAHKLKKLRTAAAALRAKHSASSRATGRFTPESPPLDKVHEEGMAWLDGLAGESFHPTECTARFSAEVWKSATRKADDVS